MSIRRQLIRAGVMLVALCCSGMLAAAQSGSGSSSSPSNSQAPPASTPQSQSGDNGTPDKPVQAPTSKDKPKPDPNVADDPGTTKIRLRVTNNQDKPVPNASVYIRFNEAGGLFHKDHLSEMNFKTNDDGSVKVPDIPIGKVLIQIVAKGYHTYGKWYDIAKDPDQIAIKLDPPPHWY